MGSARDRIKGFSDLGPDWDSYGGPKITDEAIAAALALLDEMNIPEQAIYTFPTVNGGVEVTFEIKPSGELALRMDDEGDSHRGEPPK